jgi:hypothetical protein
VPGEVETDKSESSMGVLFITGAFHAAYLVSKTNNVATPKNHTYSPSNIPDAPSQISTRFRFDMKSPVGDRSPPNL